MLYFFPQESPSDLLEKERLLLEKQIANASRVEICGYREAECSLHSNYIEWRCIHEYLKCPIKKWKLPKSSKEKIEVEPLPTDFLPLFKLNQPMYYYDSELKEKVRRIVGYREILHKREYAQYLGEVENEMRGDYGNDDDDRGAVGIKEDDNTDGEEEEEEEDWEKSDDEVETAEEDEDEDGVGEAVSEFAKFTRILARGGGKKKDKGGAAQKGKKDKGAAGGGAKGKGKSKPPKSRGGRKGGKSGGGKRGGKSDKGSKKSGKGKPGGEKADGEDKDKGPGLISRLSHFFGLGGDDDDNPKAGKWSNKHSKKDIAKAAALLEKENKENLEEIFHYHGLFRVPAQKEKDNEWLELSDSDTAIKRDEHEQEIQTFNKSHLPWMEEGLSFESQFLANSMKPYMIFLSIAGRSFMATKPDHAKKHVDFLHRRRDLIVFFLSSFFFWVCFIMITVAFADIQWENQSSQNVKTSGSLDTLEDFKNKYAYSIHEVEELELSKYQIPVAVVMINLSLTATWSLLMILGDGIYVAHYFNCWCAALAEMETSGSLGIKKKVYLHQIYMLIYTTILSVGFYYDYPRHIRFSSGEICALIVRSFERKARVKTDEDLLPFQIAGFAFQIYVMYCCSMIKLLMQISAIILKNASEMWNFKFALTFEQLVVKNRAQIMQLTLNHSLLKLFTHHRILTVLLRNFGEVFCIPIITYMVGEMAILTLILVKMFFYQAGSIDKYNNQDSVIIKSAPSQNLPWLKIPYYHSAAEDYMVFFFFFLQICFQYIGTSEVLAKSGTSFFAGYEFVRRSGTMLCKSSHHRRLIQSLEWSFSSTNPSVLSANAYFTINRESILSAFATVVGFFSLIIQLQVGSGVKIITFIEPETCTKVKDYQLQYGECVLVTVDERKDLTLGGGRISTTRRSNI